VVHEGSFGDTRRVLWWYTKGHLVVDEGSFGGT